MLSLNKISQHHFERKALFDALMASQLFQETMYPYLANLRDLRDAETLPSYDTPSPDPTRMLSYTVKTSEIDQTSITSSPLTVKFHLPELPMTLPLPTTRVPPPHSILQTNQVDCN